MATVSPIVSVCVPTYNRAPLLAQAIQSILGQTLQDFELLISDNASTDDTEAVVRSFPDPRIRYVRNQINLGHRANYGRCLQLARGAYLTMLSDDDIMMPDNIATKAEVLSKHARVGLVHSKYHVIDENGDISRYNTNWCHGPDRMEDTIESGQDVLRAMLLAFNVINTPTVMFRRACYERVGGYTDQLAHAFDFEFWMRIALYYDVAFLAKPLIKWRFHQGSQTSHHLVRPNGRPGPENWKELTGAKMLIIKHHFHDLQNGKEIKEKMSADLCQKTLKVAENMLESGEPKSQVRRFLLYMFRLLPSIVLQRTFCRTFLKSVFMSPVLTRLKYLARKILSN
jgi:glycosyltransferase involved in cell wall biosynthesis